MKVYLGADHRGFTLAEEIFVWLAEQNIAVVNVGATELIPSDDYVDYAQDVAQRVSQALGYSHEDTRGIVICGSGVGVDIAANKIKGVRCGLGFSVEQVRAARKDDDINILALPADFIDETQAKELVKVFLETPFSEEERHKRRIAKIKKIENNF